MHLRPGHVVQGGVCDGEPLGEVEAKCLSAICENIESHLQSIQLVNTIQY